METQVITEAEIKEQQLLIAQWMQVPEEIIGILNQDLPWRIREWMYLCALDQMPTEILEKMSGWELGKIQRERMGYLQKKIPGYRSDRTRDEGKSGSAGNPGCQ